MKLIPGKLYRANTGIWAMYWNTYNSVLVDSNEVVMFVEQHEDPRWRNFLNLEGQVVVIEKGNLGSLIGPL